MTSKEYLKIKLEKLSMDFPHITIRYAYNSVINYHVVELTPQSEYYNNNALDDKWIPISLEFMQTFPTEYISFVSDDSTLKVENPEFSFNEKEIIHINIEKIMNEILNTSIELEFAKQFKITSTPQIFISYSSAELTSIKIPTQNPINLNETVIKEELSISLNCDLSQAA